MDQQLINIIAGTIFLVLAIATLAIAYFFWRSIDGELRKILIWKHIGLAFMFLIFAIVSFSFDEVTRIIRPTISVLIATPIYGWSTFRMLRYLTIKK